MPTLAPLTTPEYSASDVELVPDDDGDGKISTLEAQAAVLRGAGDLLEEKSYGAGDPVLVALTPCSAFVHVTGGILVDSKTGEEMLWAGAEVLNGDDSPRTIVAGPDGAKCLMLRREQMTFVC